MARQVGDVAVYNDYRLSKYGSMSYTVHMPWKTVAVQVHFNGINDLQSWLRKELIEVLRVELDIYK